MQGVARRTRLEGAVAALAVGLLLAAFVLIQSPARAADQAVTIQNFAFNPATVTVNVGDTVTWTNQDNTAHTVTSDTGAFGSGNLNQGQSFSQTFTQAGTFAYHCAIHPTMLGTVVVTAATTTATATTATATTTTPTATATTPTSTATATATATQPAGACVLQVADQTVAANAKEVNVPRAQQARAGYVAIHESNAQGNPGPVIGFSGLFAAGTNNLNVKITLDRAVKDGEKLWAMLHTEDNGNTTYDGAAIDRPTVDAQCGNSALGNVVTFPFTVNVAVAPPATGSGESGRDDNQLFLAMAGIIGGLAIAGAGFAVMRRRR